MTTHNLLTSAQAAQRLKVDRSVITRLVQTARLVPATKLPGLRGAYLFDPAEIERLAATREKATA